VIIVPSEEKIPDCFMCGQPLAIFKLEIAGYPLCEECHQLAEDNKLEDD